MADALRKLKESIGERLETIMAVTYIKRPKALFFWQKPAGLSFWCILYPFVTTAHAYYARAL
jgi:hypothetical protein